MRCEEVREMLPAVVAEGDTLSIRRHLARCPECRREAAHYEALSAAFTGLRSAHQEPPPALVASLRELSQQQRRIDEVRTHVARNRKAYAGGAAAMVGVAGALLWRSRRLAHA